VNTDKLKFNYIEGNVFNIRNEHKKKGKEYAIIKIDKKLITILVEAIDLMSVSSKVSSKFSEKIEKYIMPRYLEINDIVFAQKDLPEEIAIEISKEYQKDLLGAFTLPNVIIGLENKGYAPNVLIKILKNAAFKKF